ncbi:hypothetical protein KC19_VG319200 [Ceratodon purpureus]|uniref:Uncharacterized protein n=1 Tax=Ceratodon purpureus TaxID=3225 RepID=A0A8T0HWL1_CERPU|nr:hypothetical protein KC19_VG319200 [Ceratodon purpureus]
MMLLVVDCQQWDLERWQGHSLSVVAPPPARNSDLCSLDAIVNQLQLHVHERTHAHELAIPLCLSLLPVEHAPHVRRWLGLCLFLLLQLQSPQVTPRLPTPTPLLPVRWWLGSCLGLSLLLQPLPPLVTLRLPTPTPLLPVRWWLGLCLGLSLLLLPGTPRHPTPTDQSRLLARSSPPRRGLCLTLPGRDSPTHTSCRQRRDPVHACLPSLPLANSSATTCPKPA